MLSRQAISDGGSPCRPDSSLNSRTIRLLADASAQPLVCEIGKHHATVNYFQAPAQYGLFVLKIFLGMAP